MGSIKMIVGIFVIVAGLYVSFKLIPPYFNDFQFRDAVKDEATRDSYSQKTEDQIRAAIFKKALEYDIPVTEDGIQVQRYGTQFNSTVVIRCPYVVHVELPGYAFDLHFDASTENKGVF
ncbi:MAG TPA: hypothetical protein VFB00_11320 [Terriglobales bacterium]|nr:hypothetical protein [Terriglobales bacterium]